VVLAIVPELEFQAVGIEEVGDGFHVGDPSFVANQALKIYTSDRVGPRGKQIMVRSGNCILVFWELT